MKIVSIFAWNIYWNLSLCGLDSNRCFFCKDLFCVVSDRLFFHLQTGHENQKRWKYVSLLRGFKSNSKKQDGIFFIPGRHSFSRKVGYNKRPYRVKLCLPCAVFACSALDYHRAIHILFLPYNRQAQPVRNGYVSRTAGKTKLYSLLCIPILKSTGFTGFAGFWPSYKGKIPPVSTGRHGSDGSKRDKRLLAPLLLSYYPFKNQGLPLPSQA